MGIGSWENTETEIKFSDIYAVEFDSYGLVHSPKSGLGHAKECFRKRLLTIQQVFFLSNLFVPFIVVSFGVMSFALILDVSVHCPRISNFAKGALSLETCRVHFWAYGFADVPELDGSVELHFYQGS